MKFICFHVDDVGNRQWIRNDDTVDRDEAYAMVPMYCVSVIHEKKMLDGLKCLKAMDERCIVVHSQELI